LVFKQENYVNIKQIKTDKNQNTQHAKTSGNPSQPTPPSFKTLITVPQRLDCTGDVTVLNQKNEKRHT
jgi:hypothetical protein